jgi:hypothetical protein
MTLPLTRYHVPTRLYVELQVSVGGKTKLVLVKFCETMVTSPMAQVPVRPDPELVLPLNDGVFSLLLTVSVNVAVAVLVPSLT